MEGDRCSSLPTGDHQVVWPKRVDPSGTTGPTALEARSRHWRRTTRGHYVPVGVDSDRVEQRIAESATALSGYGGVTGWAALRWQRGYWFSGLAVDGHTLLPVALVTGAHALRAQPGFEVSEERLNPRDLVSVDGLVITSAVRSVCFLMRYARNLREAVKCFDMAAYSDLVTLREVSSYAAELQGWTGIPQCREALLLADENCWSPMESEMRVIWVVDAGLPPPLSNMPIFDRHGRHIGTPDLLDPVAGVVGEYDGALHLAGEQRARDVRRAEEFRRVGLELFTMMSADRAEREQMAGRMRAARQRALWLPEADRAWTTVPPAWWVPTHTVEQRRSLSEADRQRWLRLRLGAG